MKYIKYLLLLLIFLIPIKVNALEINSKNAILYNMNDDEILFEKDSDEEVPIASLTKIMTSIVAIENIDDINETVTIPKEGLEGLIEANASVAGFKLNEKVTYKDLLYGSLLPSGADATQTLAYYIAGNIENYVKLMNEKANELNLKHTHFSDVTGLDDINNYSSVKDIATLLKYALKNDTFREIFTATTYTTSNKRLKLESTLLYYTNTYKLNNKYIYGSKTGFTDIAGLCLASIAKYDDMEYLLITTGASSETRYPYHFVDAFNIYDYYINNYYTIDIYNKEEPLISINTNYSKEDKYNVFLDENITKFVNKDIKKDDFKFDYQGVNIVTPFTKKGEIGTMNITLNNETIKTISIMYDGSLTLSISDLLLDNLIFIVIFIIIINIVIILLTKKKRKKKHRKQ